MKKIAAALIAALALAACSQSRPEVAVIADQIRLDIETEGGEELLETIGDEFILCLAEGYFASDLSDGYMNAYVESGTSDSVYGRFSDTELDISMTEDAVGTACQESIFG